MTDVDLAVLVLAFVLLFVGLEAVRVRLMGPDPETWSPSDVPGGRRRPCLDRSCRIDHERTAR